MSDANRLLEIIEEGINAHGGDLGGWTQFIEEQLKLFDGRVTLRADVYEMERQDPGMAHCHVFATLHDCDDEVLDACVFGMGDDREKALREAAIVWVTCVAGPIRSFLDNKPVCMTCQAGVIDGDPNEGYVSGDYGLPGLRAYVGPSIMRGFEGDDRPPTGDDTMPWFRYAYESAAPRRVHLAKSTVLFTSENGWSRELEIDGHEVAHKDVNWPSPPCQANFGYMTRFAVFEFPRNSTVVQQRAELDRTIEFFCEHFTEYDDVEALTEAMVAEGFKLETVDEVEAYSTIAFGRLEFEHLGVNYSPTILRACRDGTIETDIPLMSLPGYCRAKAIGAVMREKLPDEKWQALAYYNAESQALLNALQNGVTPEKLPGTSMYPCVVPERGVSNETMDEAVGMLHKMMNEKRQKMKQAKQKKPWWKFW
ncbi:hypothetical protein GC197_07025 [bacterium]|nr:hypothetical protein [bacterium]